VKDILFQTLVELTNIQKNQKEEESSDKIEQLIQKLNPESKIQPDGNHKIVFNKTRIVYGESEQSLFQREFNVKRITPLCEAPGILFVTNLRIYF